MFQPLVETPVAADHWHECIVCIYYLTRLATRRDQKWVPECTTEVFVEYVIVATWESSKNKAAYVKQDNTNKATNPNHE